MRGQTDLKSMKKVVIWIKNTGENLYKCLKSVNKYILMKN